MDDHTIKTVVAPFTIIRGGKDAMVKVHLPPTHPLKPKMFAFAIPTIW
jgi:hypothetical protein